MIVTKTALKKVILEELLLVLESYKIITGDLSREDTKPIAQRIGQTLQSSGVERGYDALPDDDKRWLHDIVNHNIRHAALYIHNDLPGGWEKMNTLADLLAGGEPRTLSDIVDLIRDKRGDEALSKVYDELLPWPAGGEV
ncbi:MAG: hypothetical protein CL398_09400 [Acidiferrobacteraceae bacterium]|nr:hypothetical protein [Acidiferrobacteraceae bacterium]|tara:strand:+ start:1722 stop:2141 length:420 start_codon:yes stop_codon:yes gene_type:complete